MMFSRLRFLAPLLLVLLAAPPDAMAEASAPAARPAGAWSPDSVRLFLDICEPGPRDTIVALRNRGSLPLLVTGLRIAGNAAFRLLSTPATPVSVPPDSALEVALRFAPGLAGDSYARIILENAGPSAADTVVLAGRRESAELSAYSLYFGILRPLEFPRLDTLAVRNVGTVTVTLDSAHFAGSPPFTVVAGTPVAIPPGAVRPVTLRFHDPGSDGYYSDTLTLAQRPGCAAVKVLVAGIRATAPIIAGPSSVDFGAMYCRASERDTVIALLNRGAYDLFLNAWSINGDPSFSFLSRLPKRIAPGASDTVRIRFRPSAPGVRTATLQLSTNAVNAPVFQVALAGVYDLPTLALDALRFGDVKPYQFPRTASLVARNPSLTVVAVDSVTASPAAPFAATGPFPVFIGPGDSASIPVRFSDPGADGSFAATLTAHASPSCSAATAAAEGSRSSAPRIEAASPVDMRRLLCPGSTADTLLAIRNNGGSELRISGVSISGDAAFSLPAPPATPFGIAPGATDTLRLRYAPATVGAHAAVLHIASNAANLPAADIPVAGRKDSLGLAFGAADFGTLQPPQFPALRPLALRNTGTVPVTLLAAAPRSGAHFSAAVALPALLAPGDTLRIDLRFADPGADGSYADTLDLATSPSCGPAAVPLSGARASRPGLQAPSSLAFAPELRCDGEERDTAILLRNTGYSTLTVASAAISGDTAFALLPPLPPFAVAAGDSALLRLRFRSAVAGTHAAQLEIASNAPNAPLFRVALEGRRERIALELPAADFDSVLRGAFPVDRALTLRNTGTLPLRIAAASLPPGAPFAVTQGVPADLAPGAAATVTVRFLDPGVDTAVAAGLVLTLQPSCGDAVIALAGVRITASAELVVDDAHAAPGQTVAIAVTLANTRHLARAGATVFRGELAVNGSLLAPLALPSTVDAGGTLRASFSIGAGDPPPARFSFIAGLGNDTACAIALENLRCDGDVELRATAGRFRLDGVCREGGLRLVDATGRLALQPAHPNPFNAATVVEFETIEAGPSQLAVLDALGRRVAVLAEGFAAGRYRVAFDAAALPSGRYYCVLRTPSAVLVRPMQLVK